MTRVRSLSRSAFRSLRIRNYRLYFAGQVASVSGTWMQQLAQAWLVLELTGSGVALGIATALQFLPMLLFGVWGGLVADRADKRRLLFFTQGAAGLLAVGLGVLVVLDSATLGVVYLFSLLLGFVNLFDNPARQTFVLEMVGKDDLPNAVTLNSVIMNLSRVVGPAIGGVVIAIVGLAPCFFVNAASYLAVILALSLMDTRALHRAETVGRRPGQLREGLRYVWSTPDVRTPLLLMAVVGMLAYNFHVVLPLLATRTFGAGAAGFGGLISVMGVGAVLGGLAVAAMRGDTSRRLVFSAFGFGTFILASALAPTIAIEIVTLLLLGAFSISFISTGNATLQLRTEPEMRGRVMALYAIAFLGTTPIGSPFAGWVAQHFGPRSALALGGTATLIAASVAARGILRSGSEAPPAVERAQVGRAETVTELEQLGLAAGGD